jgi:hypothetical protein
MELAVAHGRYAADVIRDVSLPSVASRLARNIIPSGVLSKNGELA